MPSADNHAERTLRRISEKTPKKAEVVLFVGREEGAFLDNTKYAFLDCVRHFPHLSGFYLTHDPALRDHLRRHGLPALLFPEPEAIQAAASAGVVVSDDFWWRSHSPVHALLEKARLFQLWHGIPLKKIGFPEISSCVNMDPKKAAYLRYNYSGYDAVLSTSPWFTAKAFAPSFEARDFPELGYPRNDALLRPPDKYDMLNVDAVLYGELVQLRKAGWKVAFYMPTFRDLGGDPFSGGALTAGKLLPFLERNKVLLVCKFHPYVKITLNCPSPHLRFYPSSCDPYPMLRLADMLLTDYSSVYFDFLLLQRPILFFVYDHDDYIRRNRELNFDFDEYTPGPKVGNEDDLYRQWKEMLSGKDDHVSQRDDLLKKSFSHADSRSGIRVNSYIVDNYMQHVEDAGSHEVRT